MLPLNERNLYSYPASNPTHLATCGKPPLMSVSLTVVSLIVTSILVEQFSYKLPFEWYCGGVILFTMEQFEKINGMGNVYFGWGKEDDDLFRRYSGLSILLTGFLFLFFSVGFLQVVSNWRGQSLMLAVTVSVGIALWTMEGEITVPVGGTTSCWVAGNLNNAVVSRFCSDSCCCSVGTDRPLTGCVIWSLDWRVTERVGQWLVWWSTYVWVCPSSRRK